MAIGVGNGQFMSMQEKWIGVPRASGDIQLFRTDPFMLAFRILRCNQR